MTEAKTEFIERERLISAMVRAIEHVDVPKEVIEVSEVSEFGESEVKSGRVIYVNQGYLGSTEKLPILTDYLDKCVALLLCTPQPDGRRIIDLVHIQGGVLDDNVFGNKRDDIIKRTNDKTVAIFVHSDKSFTTNKGTAREIAYGGVTTQKIITVHSGRSNIAVMYKPENDTIYVRINDTAQVLVFSGFGMN